MSGFMTVDSEEELQSYSDGSSEYEFIALSISRSQMVDGYEEYVEYQVAHNNISNRQLPRIKDMREPRAPISKIEDVGFVGDRTSDVRYYDGNEKAIQTPLVNVMMIAWAGGIARRKGIGQIYLARWKDAELRAKKIILE
jgi:hypothetical protein